MNIKVSVSENVQIKGLAVHQDIMGRTFLSHSEARKLAMAILTLTEGQNPVKAQGTASVGILQDALIEDMDPPRAQHVPDGDWVLELIHELQSQGRLIRHQNSCAEEENKRMVRNSIRKHLPKSTPIPTPAMTAPPSVADDGVKAAAYECWKAVYDETGQYSGEQAPPDAFNAIIAKYCVGKWAVEERNYFERRERDAFNRAKLISDLMATEKARADNLQAELDFKCRVNNELGDMHKSIAGRNERLGHQLSELQREFNLLNDKLAEAGYCKLQEKKDIDG